MIRRTLGCLVGLALLVTILVLGVNLLPQAERDIPGFTTQVKRDVGLLRKEEATPVPSPSPTVTPPPSPSQSVASEDPWNGGWTLQNDGYTGTCFVTGADGLGACEAVPGSGTASLCFRDPANYTLYACPDLASSDPRTAEVLQAASG